MDYLIIRYSPELRDEIASYAHDHGVGAACDHFTVTPSTVRNFLRAFQTFSPTLREEVGLLAYQFGAEFCLRVRTCTCINFIFWSTIFFILSHSRTTNATVQISILASITSRGSSSTSWARTRTSLLLKMRKRRRRMKMRKMIMYLRTKRRSSSSRYSHFYHCLDIISPEPLV